MDTSKEYKLMCYKAKQIQEQWQPEEGDYMVALASYHGESKDCSDSNICPSCLEMDNVYVISVKTNFHESVGGTHWFYGGGACVKGYGCKMNDTHQYVMTRSGETTIEHAYCSPVSGKLWLPRQDQIQKMFFNDVSDIEKTKLFVEWIDKANYLPSRYSLEMLWLMFYMWEVYGLEWNPMKNRQDWES